MKNLKFQVLHEANKKLWIVSLKKDLSAVSADQAMIESAHKR